MTNLAAPQEQDLVFEFKGYTVRRWTTRDREKAECVLRACWEEYGLPYEPELGEKHNIWVEDCYVRSEKGEFWVVMDEHSVLVGTAGYYEVSSTEKAVEIRKLYLLPEARGKKLGRALLEALESRIEERGYHKIYAETTTVLVEACNLYYSAGYFQVSEPVKHEVGDQRLCKMIVQNPNTA